jgi:coproporphyrinogen III oxidase-like Fe-S oxidoreductase
VSIVRGNFYVNTFSLEKYDALLTENRLPIVGWRKLSEKEYLRYYLLTKLFGLEVDTNRFQEKFHIDIGHKLRGELTSLRRFAIVAGTDRLKVTLGGMYPVSVMMREFFAALNGLRELYIEKQI